MLSQKAGQ